VFFAFVIDGYSRRIVGWQLVSHMRTTLVLDALRMALHQRGAAPITKPSATSRQPSSKHSLPRSSRRSHLPRECWKPPNPVSAEAGTAHSDQPQTSSVRELIRGQRPPSAALTDPQTTHTHPCTARCRTTTDDRAILVLLRSTAPYVELVGGPA